MVLKKKAHWNWYHFYSFNENIYFKRATLPLCEMSPNTEFFPVRISAFGLNTERLSLRIQSKCGKIRNRKNSVFGHFSRSVRKYYHDTGFLRLVISRGQNHDSVLIRKNMYQRKFAFLHNLRIATATNFLLWRWILRKIP